MAGEQASSMDKTSKSEEPGVPTPNLTEVDEYGFLLDRGDSVMIAETNTPDPQSRISWRVR